MAGHSKFKNIMHRKGAQDARRAKKFARLIKELQVASRGSLDPQNNPRLKTALAACKSANMPKDNIDKVLKKANSEDTDKLEEIRYEGYGPSGIAIIVEAVTDNRNRTASEVRASFAKYGGNLGEKGSVSYLFKNLGQIVYNTVGNDEEEILEFAIEAGASDVNSYENSIEIITNLSNFNEIREKLEDRFGSSEQAEIVWIPENLISLDEEKSSSLLKLLEMLDDCDDVQNVFGNFELDEKVVENIN